ncbi:MAG: SDR family oxidoreductase [Sandaracinus sp.]|nr:SDR family oxidoreductase [Sandaracinus sp.]
MGAVRRARERGRPRRHQDHGHQAVPAAAPETAQKSAPLKRLGSAEEVSHLIVYLGSTQADFITGQTFYIDGGQSLWGDQWPIPDEIPRFPPYPID